MTRGKNLLFYEESSCAPNGMEAVAKDDAGFTIHETLVALIVCSVLFSLGLSLFSLMNRQFTRWHAEEEARQHVHRVLHRVALDIQQSRNAAEITDSSLMLARGIGKPITYQFDGKAVWRNGINLNSLDSLALVVKVVPVGSDVSSEAFDVAVTGTTRSWSYRASAVTAITHSSRSRFINGL